MKKPGSAQARRVGALPQIEARPTRKLDGYRRGQKPDDPIQVGDPDETLVYVEAAGMAGGLRKGERGWVTGSQAAHLVKIGAFVAVTPPDPPPVIDRTPPVPPTVPQEDRTPVLYCRDCTTTWKASAKPACTCEPVDESQWTQLTGTANH